jgi:DNA-binding beta-propeller fold protein YncE
MSNKTIAKFIGLVISIAAGSLLATSCSQSLSTNPQNVSSAELSQNWGKPVIVGRIESKDVKESSGLAASQCQPNVYWTHNDSGDDALIFAMDETGKDLGTFEVTNASNDDWEDIAEYRAADGTCYLYIADTGNNKLERPELTVYRVKEPTVSRWGEDSDDRDSSRTEPAQAGLFKYQDTPHNAETLMVNPQTGDVYVLTKRLDGPSFVFKFTPSFGSKQPVIAQKVGEVSVPSVPNGLLTGGAISPDAKRIILCDYTSGYELRVTTATFDDVWKSKPVPVDLGERKHGEAITFSSDGKAILGTNEGKKAEIFEVKLK